MANRYDPIVVSAGIAGLGVAAILSKEARQKVLVLDRFPRAGGRLMSYKDYPEKGWTVDVGLHMIELGEKSGCAELNRPVGREIEWATNSAARSAMECADLILENRKFYT